jgi:spermidine/putrescine transport system ATP-binding protein
MNTIELKNISKEFDGVKVLEDINLFIRKNEFLTLLGPSGCGKTTTLRIIGGFEQPTEGRVIFEDEDITNVAPYKRQINTVFQKYALFPHMNIYENIAFGLRIKKLPKDVIDSKVSEMLRLVNLQGFENRSIESLSGGQQQRIAIARALVNEPKVLLLDEPLGALDLKLRKEMQIELKNMQKRVGITFIYVTHDQEEALTMSDTIVVMNKGEIQQIGTPIDIYNEPKNSFVAKFIGESNIIPGIMHEDFLVEFNNKIFKCVDKGFKSDEEVDVVIRPEDINIVSAENSQIKGIVESIIFKGVHYEMIVRSDDYFWMIHSTIMKPVDTEIGMEIAPDNIHIMKREE